MLNQLVLSVLLIPGADKHWVEKLRSMYIACIMLVIGPEVQNKFLVLEDVTVVQIRRVFCFRYTFFEVH